MFMDVSLRRCIAFRTLSPVYDAVLAQLGIRFLILTRIIRLGRKWSFELGSMESNRMAFSSSGLDVRFDCAIRQSLIYAYLEMFRAIHGCNATRRTGD